MFADGGIVRLKEQELINGPSSSASITSNLKLSMNSEDCFHLAQIATQSNEFTSAQAWAQEALQRLRLEEPKSSNGEHELGVVIRKSLHHFQTKLSEDTNANDSYVQNFNALCRGEKVPSLLSEIERSQLVCFYLDVSKLGPGASHLTLTNIRVEEASRRPNIV